MRRRRAGRLGWAAAGEQILRSLVVPAPAMTQAPPAALVPGLSAAGLHALHGLSLPQLQALSLADLEGLGLRGEELRMVYRSLRETHSFNAGRQADYSPQLTPQPSGGLRWGARAAGLPGCSSTAEAPTRRSTRRRRNLARPTDSAAGRMTTWSTWGTMTTS